MPVPERQSIILLHGIFEDKVTRSQVTRSFMSLREVPPKAGRRPPRRFAAEAAGRGSNLFDEQKDCFASLRFARNDAVSKASKFFVLEGRPNLEAAVQNCRTLLKSKIKPTLIADNMAGFLFFKNCVKEVRLAYQYKDSQGALCDIGALILGALARRHKVPVVLYPAQRRTRFLGNPQDLLKFQGKRIAPKGARAYAPLVEWLPKKYITSVYD